MAYVNPNEENPNAPQNKTALDQQAPVSSGGAGVGGASKPGNTPGVNVPAQPSAQLSAYLAANQPQSEAFGQNVAQKVGAQINAAGQAIQPAVNTYTSSLYSVPVDAATNAAVAKSPSSLTAEQKASYQKQLGAAGAAPNAANTFETTAGYQDAAHKIQGAVEQADLWNSGNNVSNLTTALSPFEGPNATAGDRSLDSLLLSRTPGAYQKIQGAVAPAAGYQDQLASGTSSANAALRAAIAQDQATTPAAQAAAQQYATGLNTSLAGYLANAQAANNTYNSDLNLVSDQVAGLQPKISSLKDVIDSFNTFVKGPTNPGIVNGKPVFQPIEYGTLGTLPTIDTLPAVGTMASRGQYSDVAALKALLDPSTYSSLNLGIDPTQANLAETYRAPTQHVPLAQNIVDPLVSPTAAGFVKNDQAVANNKNNAAVGNVLSNYTAVQNAYKALMDALNGTAPIGTPAPPSSGGSTGGGKRPI